MQKPNFQIFPELQTDRLNLRRLSLNDANEMHQLRSNIEVAALTGRKPAESLEESIAFINKIDNLVNENESIYWVITYKDKPTMLGAICLYNFDLPNETIEVGYELLPQFQHKGLMSKALKCILNYGFDTLEVKTITAFPSDDNPPSIKVLEKTGFKLVDQDYYNTHENVPGMLTYIIDSNLLINP